MTQTNPVRSKRSKAAAVALLGVAALALSACKDDEKVAAQVFPDKAACLASVDKPDRWWTKQDCETSFQHAQELAKKNAPRFDDRAACEAEFPGQCQSANNDSGGSFFMPMMAGYMIGNLLNSGSSRPYGEATPLYKDRSNTYRSAGGGFKFSGNAGTTTLSKSSFARKYNTTINSAGSFRPKTSSYGSNSSYRSGGFGGSRSSGFGG